ncbi:nucleotide-binding domain-containing protein [Photobacterium damselae]|uniref:nucleotide-binding domain-containing protein n=1 Tax=Photobacterium damselae TaxID=38293 RepID=UPI000D66356C|nr:nucleotidyltransferase [Photobacterium damselae]AWK83221.1 nucleotidyltransferase [Photobacterium damselae]
MSVSEDFNQFLVNIRVDNSGSISDRYGQITKALNKQFRNTESTTANTLQVGSYGRYTGIKGISDLDMLYIMPDGKWDTYKDKQSQLLRDTKDAILNRYPTTDVKVDSLVVVVQYQNFKVEVQPVFEQEDGSFKYPYTHKGGSWRITKPKDEINAMKEVNEAKNKNLRPLCKMARAWKNKHGVAMGGLLIDTLAHNFLNGTSIYDNKGPSYYDEMCRDFFEYLSELPKQDRWNALGSNQHVKVKKNFQRAAKKAYELCVEAIKDNNNEKWRKVFGRGYPQNAENLAAIAQNRQTWLDTEEFIDDKYHIDIRYHMTIDCDVSQNGYREYSLSHMLRHFIPLRAKKSLSFRVSEIDVPEPYSLKWKVLNRGSEAERRDCIRGQILDDEGYGNRSESTTFSGEHSVECYAIKDGVVVARSEITVPISN